MGISPSLSRAKLERQALLVSADTLGPRDLLERQACQDPLEKKELRLNLMQFHHSLSPNHHYINLPITVGFMTLAAKYHLTKYVTLNASINA